MTAIEIVHYIKVKTWVKKMEAIQTYIDEIFFYSNESYLYMISSLVILVRIKG
jgi:hypothetical protein